MTDCINLKLGMCLTKTEVQKRNERRRIGERGDFVSDLLKCPTKNTELCPYFSFLKTLSLK